VPVQTIDLRAAVQSAREKCTTEARSAFEACLQWLGGAARESAIHEVEGALQVQLLALGRALVVLWLALRLPDEVLATMTHGQASYRFQGLRTHIARTRFGEVSWIRPVYQRVYGRGPASLAPMDRQVGLAAGRMTLGVHLTAGFLAARMAFDEVVDVLRHLGEYVPSKRALLGIVDRLGPTASRVLGDMPAPEDDGEILVIQGDDKGAPMLGSAEHARRCKPHKKGRARTKGARGRRRQKRNARPRARRTKGKKSKNARMAKVIVIYTLRRNRDGTLDGPINKRVIATFGNRRRAFEIARREAVKRGYGKKPTYFLADGSHAIWAMWRAFFPLATPCLDWYHVCEYLWRAGGTVLREGSSELAAWVHERKRQLLAGQIDAMLAAIRQLRSSIGNSGPGTKGRRDRLAKAIAYLDGHRDRLRYRELARVDMDIATGAVEGAVNHVVGKRLDGSMMRWTRARAEHVLALRCIVVNGLWNAFEDAVAVEHARCRDPVIRRITPDRPQEPYDAVRKAA
jgi:hypothetical protein